jgi:selenocysteine lyase/cysteine desulfurase
MIPCQRHLFDMPEDVAYLNCGYMAPLMNAVVEAGKAGVARKARPWTISTRDFFDGSEQARALFAELVGAKADSVALIPAVSYGVAVAARNLRLGPGRRVVMLADQFPSHVYSWRDLAAREGGEAVFVDRPAAGDLSGAVLAAIDERTAIAALPHCRWTDGALLDLVRIGERCREVGAALVIDATQSLGALPFDVKQVRPAFLIGASYKWLLGPYSLGFVYVDPSYQQGEPLEHGWITRAGSEDFAGLVRYRDDLSPGARRYDVGERSNFALVPMAIAALRQILDWGVDAIAATLATRTTAIAERAASLGLGALPSAERAGHYLGIQLEGGVPPGLPEALAAEHVYVSVRGSSVRVTPHLYNTDGDVERLFYALTRAL